MASTQVAGEIQPKVVAFVSLASKGECMVKIDGETVFALTAKQLVGGIAGTVVVFGACLWAVLTFTLGNLRDDVSDIRDAVTTVEGRNANTHQVAVATDAELKSQVASLTAELRLTNANLTSLTNSTAKLDESVMSVNARLQNSIGRQEHFERWVVTRLASSPAPDSVPAEWQKIEGTVVDELATGDDPLSQWYRAMSQR